MIKELYKITTIETTLNVTNNYIDSIRNKHITKSCCRVYDGEYIGISSTLGDETEEVWKEAEENLKLKITYKYKPESNKKRTRNLCENIDSESFVSDAEKLMEQMRMKFPEFIFNNKIILTQTITRLTNDAGLEYEDNDRIFVISMTVKHVDSANVFDTMVYGIMRSWDADKFLAEAEAQLNAYCKSTELPKDCKVLINADFQTIGAKLTEYMNGRLIGKESSPFSSKLGEKLFSSKLTVYSYRGDESILMPFFDSEGSTCEDDKCALIENGILLRPYSDKMNSDEFGFTNTASAGGAYDDVPTLSADTVWLKDSGKTYAELVDGKEWINAVLISGGDCTNEGDFSSPVQIAYLMKGTEYIGRLPEFNVSGNIYDLFGEDYVGTSSDRALFGDRVSLFYAKVSK